MTDNAHNTAKNHLTAAVEFLADKFRAAGLNPIVGCYSPLSYAEKDTLGIAGALAAKTLPMVTVILGGAPGEPTKFLTMKLEESGAVTAFRAVAGSENYSSRRFASAADVVLAPFGINTPEPTDDCRVAYG